VRDLIQPFRKAMARLVRPGDRIAVGVSGGADSVALLDLADRARVGLEIDLVVAHFDHGWRPESADDAAFVAGLAEARGLGCVVERATDLPRTEAAGRAARLAFFRRLGAAGVLLGHTLDDKSETVITHLLRGAGLQGVAGMMACAEVDGVRLLRPMLGVRRADVRAYCARRGLAFHDDPSNDDPAFLRNRVRHDLLPRLDRIAPGAVGAIGRFADAAAADLELVERAVDAGWTRVVVERCAEEVAIDRPCFRAEPVAVQRGVLRRVGEALIGPAPDLPFERVEAAREALLRGRGGAVIEWPARVALRVHGRRGTFVRSPA